MNRPIDPDMDDKPRVHAMSIEQLRRDVIHFSREFAEERTENRKLRAKLKLAVEALEELTGNCPCPDAGTMYQISLSKAK